MNKKNILRAIFIGLVITVFSVAFPYLSEPHHQNTAKWSVPVQFGVLWLAASIIIFCIDRNAEKRRC